MKKKLFLIFAVLCITISAFSLELVKQYNRPGSIQIPAFEKEIIKKDTKGMDIEQIINYSVKLTARTLTFSTHCEPVTFKKVTKAHCVLYAKTLSSICNYAFQINSINAHAVPVVGYPKSCDINLCKVLSSILSFNTHYKNFTKNHDFVEITSDKRTDYVDACAYDLIGDDLRSVIYK